MRLALGTVQFGLAYGIANDAGQVPEAEAARILSRARDAGIDTLDTAAAYGSAEQLLGRIGSDGFRIVTKVPALPAGTEDPRAWVTETLLQSLKRLGKHSADAVLLHRAADLLDGDGAELWAGLRQTREAGLCARIGFSVYDPNVLEALPDVVKPDLIQAPFNVFDRRLEASGWAERLAEEGCAIHLRSAFLQGLLLMPAALRAARFQGDFPQLGHWDALLADTGVAPAAAALGFALAQPWAERVVVGVDTAAQLAELTAAGAQVPLDIPATLASLDPGLIDPSQWGTT